MRPQQPSTTIDTGVGRALIRPDPRHPSVQVLVIDEQVHGAVDIADQSNLTVDYQIRLTDLVLALLGGPSGPVVHLGGGALAIPRALAARWTADGHDVADQLVIERSGAIIKLVGEHLRLAPVPNLVVRKGDARAALARLDDHGVAMVIGDAFNGSLTPRHLQTHEFLTEVKRVLRPGGTYIVNLIDEAPYPVLAANASTAMDIFSTVVAVAARGVARLRDPGNVFLVATDRAVSVTDLGHRLAVGAHPSALVSSGRLEALARSTRPRHDTDG